MNPLGRFLGWLTGAVPVPVPAPPPVPGPDGSIAAALLAAHNAERRKAGLTPLASDPQLVALAEAHSGVMARSGVLTHNGADGPLARRLARAGYRSAAAAENVAFNQPSVAAAVAAWMASTEGHRENILGPYTRTGGAVSVGAKGPFWTVIFARPA